MVFKVFRKLCCLFNMFFGVRLDEAEGPKVLQKQIIKSWFSNAKFVNLSFQSGRLTPNVGDLFVAQN